MRLRKLLRLKPLTPQTKRWLAIAGLSGLLVIVLAARIRSLPNGLSESERQLIDSVRLVKASAADFLVDWPYKMGLKVLLRLTGDSLLSARLLSLGLSAGGLVVFYCLARQWWSRFVAGSTTVLLATSQWFLISARLIGPQAINLALTTSLLLLFVRLKHEARWWQASASGLITGLALYFSPLVGWLAICLTLLALVYSIHTKLDRRGRGWLLYSAGLGVAAFPLLLGLVVHGPHVLVDVLGLDTFRGPNDLVNHSLAVLRGLTWDGREIPLLLPGIGLLDWVTLSFALLGLFRCLATWRLDRSQALLVTSVIAGLAVLVSERWYNGLAILIPPTYLLVARGLNHYLYVWRQRFPRNLSARFAGLCAVVFLIGAVSLYNLRAYYVAWARSEVVQSQFKPYNKPIN